MDYIYKNSKNKKCVGEITGLEVTPMFDFQLTINKKYLWCQLDHILMEWCLHFVNLNQHIELADPTDVLWNTEAIFEVLKDVNQSMQLAYAIKHIYEKFTQ